MQTLAACYRDPMTSVDCAIDTSFSTIAYAIDERKRDFSRELVYFTSELRAHIPRQVPTAVDDDDRAAAHVWRDFRLRCEPTGCVRQFTFFQLALTAFLRSLGTTPLVVGIVFSNRQAANGRAIAYLANTLPIRFALQVGSSAAAHLEHVRLKLAEAAQHSSLPLVCLVRALSPSRAANAKNPLFDLLVSYEDFAVQKVGDGRATVSAAFSVREVPARLAKLGQTWALRRLDATQLAVHVEYTAAHKSHAQIEAAIDSFGAQLDYLLTIGDDVEKFDLNTSFHDLLDDARSRLFGELRELAAAQLAGLQLAADDNFFESGAHSLTAARLAAAVRERLGLACSTRLIFENQTLNALTSALQRGATSTVAAAANDVQRPRFAHVSYLQLPILRYLTANAGDTKFRLAYTHRFCVRLPEMDGDAVRRQLSELVGAHEALRTSFACTADGTIVARIDAPPPIGSLTLPYVVEAKHFGHIVCSIALHDGDRLEFRLSHLIFDGISAQILLDELRSPSTHQTEATSPSEFARAFNADCDRDCERKLSFWTRQLDAQPAQLYRNVTAAVASCNSSDASTSVERRVSLAHTTTLVKRERVSPAAVYLHAVAETMQHWLVCGGEGDDDEQQQLYVGLTTDSRAFDGESRRFERTIGFFTQVLPIATRQRSLGELNAQLYDAYENATVRFDQLADKLRRTTLFDICVAIENEAASDDDDEAKAIEVLTDESNEEGKFSLNFFFNVGRNTIKIRLVYAREFWPPTTAATMLDLLAHTLDPAAIESPLIRCVSTPPSSTQYVDPLDRLLALADELGDAPAIVTPNDDETLSYDKLGARIRKMAATIKQNLKSTTIADTIVVVLVDHRRVRSIVAYLAVMHAG